MSQLPLKKRMPLTFFAVVEADNINRERLSRGLGTAGEARVRCFRCKKVGHFSKNCPSKKHFNKEGAASSSSGASGSQTKVSYVMAMSDEGPCTWLRKVAEVLRGKIDPITTGIAVATR